jgi:transcriptional regulator with XRE-family HTH domain
MPTTARKAKPKSRPARLPTQFQAWRKHRKMTLENAASHLEGGKRGSQMSHSQLSRIERGIAEYRQSHVETLARVYHTSIWALLFCPPNVPHDELFAIFQRSIKPLSDP